jgi:hypothetical protein
MKNRQLENRKNRQNDKIIIQIYRNETSRKRPTIIVY